MNIFQLKEQLNDRLKKIIDFLRTTYPELGWTVNGKTEVMVTSTLSADLTAGPASDEMIEKHLDELILRSVVITLKIEREFNTSPRKVQV